ncbi:hypothetical protein ACJMK2_016353 [Sinanodonta woodiana]|uniref:Uncharacterized protein n=1 Tax=Sinanodonta woodiana TaxID=1069815 RepID=A0ABD3UVE9_SINWO
MVIHTDIIVTESGLCVNVEYSCLGSNPNGLVTCKHCVESLKLIKVKCPFKFGDMTPLEAAKDPSFCCEAFILELFSKHISVTCQDIISNIISNQCIMVLVCYYIK